MKSIKPDRAGLRLIIRYKVAKASIELLTSLSFFLLGWTGSAQTLSYAAQVVLHHATERWSIAVAKTVLDKTTAHNVSVIAIALIADGLVTAVEGVALARGYRWARWLVVCTTGALIPFEFDGMIRHPTLSHILLLLINVLIVAYLVWRHETPVSQQTAG